MDPKILLIGLIIAAIALSGCFQFPPICGNTWCEAGEHWGEPRYCPADCPPPSGAVKVTLIDGDGPVGHADVQLRTAAGNVVAEMESNENGVALFNGVAPGTYFVDVEKTGYAKFKSEDYDVKEGVTVKIEAKLTPVSVGLATVVVGNGVVRIADGKQYPYDPTDTDVTNDYWLANLDFNTNRNMSPAVATLKKITVKNNVQRWSLGAGVSATFLEREDPNTVGYNFAGLRFLGWSYNAAAVDVFGPGGTMKMSAIVNSNPGAVEFIKNFDNTAFSGLFNTAKPYRYNASVYEIIVKEWIGLEADARSDNNVLKLYIENTGDFNYVLDLGNGIPCWEDISGATKFTDGDNDNVMIPFLGSEYAVQEADCVSTVKKLTLVKEQAKANYYEGQWIEGLEGIGSYEGQEMKIKVGPLMRASGTSAYSMVFELYDEEGRLVHRLAPISEGTYLNETFVDSSGNYALKTIVYVDSIRFSLTGGGGGSTR